MNRVRLLGSVCFAAGTAVVAACTGAPSALDPRGPDALAIANLGWTMIVIASVICALVAVYVLAGVAWPGGYGGERAALPGGIRGGAAFVAVGGVIVPVLILAGVLGSTVLTLRQISDRGNPAGSAGPPALTVDIIGHQWWWEVVYPDARVVTANEIHIPVAVPVRFRVVTQDVIHSFWVPQLTGKLDLIPGQVNVLQLRADQPGVYRGQCAEYCGLQHAHMALYVFADRPAEFSAWLAQQQRPARLPQASAVQRGQRVFVTAGCVQCHTIRGFSETGRLGPDLTHLASRRTIAAGTLPLTVGNLGGWIENSQAIKPGNLMPPLPMEGADLQALLTFLATLD